ncbi:hypothetical protein TI39_contig5854g00005 [Zymoseptoria brevis]|uniref:Uncharacterized protein n=1 Tax=Zymoseptoria brevis TaxID=1047168 RepID=A0A0F4G4Z8_9PEZI|nr:hypothetical protein TI39_contig5854g00005 [Zymoseptoria brevis]
MPVFDLNVESMQTFYLACQAAIWYMVNEDGQYREAHRVADDAMSHNFGARMFWVMACENADRFVHHVQKYGRPTRDQSMEPVSTAILVKYVQRGGKKASSGDRARMIQTLAEQAREYLDVLILMRERGEEDINFRTISGPELAQESRHPRPGKRVLYQGPDIVFGKEEIQVSKGRLPHSELRRSIQREKDNVRLPKDIAEAEFSARRVLKIHEPRTDRRRSRSRERGHRAHKSDRRRSRSREKGHREHKGDRRKSRSRERGHREHKGDLRRSRSRERGRHEVRRRPSVRSGLKEIFSGGYIR